jgi:hypothetical protein
VNLPHGNVRIPARSAIEPSEPVAFTIECQIISNPKNGQWQPLSLSFSELALQASGFKKYFFCGTDYFFELKIQTKWSKTESSLIPSPVKLLVVVNDFVLQLFRQIFAYKSEVIDLFMDIIFFSVLYR